MAKDMKTRKGKDGFHYPYTSPDLVIDENGKSNTKKFEEISSQFKDIAKQVGTETLNTTAQDLKGAINEVFQNVSNGKQLIATAITDKGVNTSSDATFQTMANNIGKISGGSSITYSVTNNLSHAVNNNSNTRIEKYNSYSANITVETGYKLNSITVTMGGTDITSSCYSNGNISIEHVTGDIVITVTTSVIPPNTYSVTNKLTQCTSNNNSTTVTERQSYTATITANNGYTVNSIVVKMGNTDISSSAVSGNIITIANVTGNIVITATATQNALYSFGVMSDMHIPTDETSDTVYGSKYQGITKFTNVINKLKDTDIDFLCTTGDLTTYGYNVQYDNLSNILKNLNKPFYTCSGNHDGTYSDEKNTMWNNKFGHDMNYVFTKNNDVFIFLSFKNIGTSINPYDTFIDWLETQLNSHKNKRVFLFMHYPIRGYAGLKTNQVYGFLENATEDERILKLLKQHLNVHCFNGHTHYIFELQEKYPNINVSKLDYYYTSLIHVPSLTQPRNDTGNLTNLSESNQYLEMWKVNVYADKIVLNAINLVNNQVLYTYEIDTNADYTRSNELIVSTFNVALNEGSTSGAITIGLEKAPNENVTINIASNNQYVTPSKTSITFTPTNYSDTFTVSAVDDGTTADYTCLIEITSDAVPSLDINIAVTNTTVEIPSDGIPRYDISAYATGPNCAGIPYFKHDDYKNYPYVYLNPNTVTYGEVYITSAIVYHLGSTQRFLGSYKRYRWSSSKGWYQYKEGASSGITPITITGNGMLTHGNVAMPNGEFVNNQLQPTEGNYFEADLTSIN
jgi:predicted MPP superfamily phosphohydrolase